MQAVAFVLLQYLRVGSLKHEHSGDIPPTPPQNRKPDAPKPYPYCYEKH